MPYESRFDKNGSCAIQGQKAEDVFRQLLERDGATVTLANLEQQRIQHIDFIASKNGKEETYEVKARKRIKRGDESYNDDLIYIEFQNVAGGLGWLYGKADWLSFEGENDFVIVNRLKLIEMAENKCNISNLSTYPSLYLGYKRRGRNDLLSLVKKQDVLDIASRIIKK